MTWQWFETQENILRIKLFRQREFCEPEDSDRPPFVLPENFAVLEYSGVMIIQEKLECREVNDEYCTGYYCEGYMLVKPLCKGAYVRIIRRIGDEGWIEKYVWDGEKWSRIVEEEIWSIYLHPLGRKVSI